jgi:hypothetical protein
MLRDRVRLLSTWTGGARALRQSVSAEAASRASWRVDLANRCSIS